MTEEDKDKVRGSMGNNACDGAFEGRVGTVGRIWPPLAERNWKHNIQAIKKNNKPPKRRPGVG